MTGTHARTENPNFYPKNKYPKNKGDERPRSIRSFTHLGKHGRETGYTTGPLRWTAHECLLRALSLKKSIAISYLGRHVPLGSWRIIQRGLEAERDCCERREVDGRKPQRKVEPGGILEPELHMMILSEYKYEQLQYFVWTKYEYFISNLK